MPPSSSSASLLRLVGRPPLAALGTLPRALLLAAAAFVASLLADLPGVPGGALLLPAGALALAAAWRGGMRCLVPVAFGAAGWALVQGTGPVAIAVAFAASCIGPALALLLLRRLSAWQPVEHRLGITVRFVGAVTLVAAPVDGLIAAAGTALDQAYPGGAAQALVAWWLADALGMLLLTPALLALRNTDLSSGIRQGAEEELQIAPGALVLALALALLALVAPGAGGPWTGMLLLAAHLPLVAWIAVRLSERSAAVTLLVCTLPLLTTLGLATAIHRPDIALPLWHIQSALLIAATLVGLLMQALAADRRLALERVSAQARQDLSTGLLNDRGLLVALGRMLEAPQRPAHGLIGIHIGNFDTIHDLCGPIQSLQLEQRTAELLSRQPGGGQAARLSSGRFALLFSADTVAQVRQLARALYAELNRQVYKADNGSIRLQASVGGLLLEREVAIEPEDCLLSLSDAMAIASSVRDPQLFVEPLSRTMIDARRAHQARIEHIRSAIRQQRLEMHAQPIVDPDAPPGMRSYEILARLRDRDGTMIRPPEFLPLAVQAQLTVELDRGVIQKVFGWLAAHPEALAQTHKCSINLSGLTMSEGTIAAYVREQRALNGIPARKVVFEITESEAIRDPAAAARLVEELRQEGFGIALDDFGTGLATFEYLKRFPIDYLKIDGSFIRNLIGNPIDEEIVLSTLRVAGHLKVRTVAEHVHSVEIYERLQALGVRYIQGELIGAAMPLETLFDTPQGWPPGASDQQRRP